MKKGEAARASVVATIEKAFKEQGSLEGIQDKKIYVWAQDGPTGERIQYAITITAPKVAVSCGGTVSNNDAPWEDTPQTIAPASTQLSEADKKKVTELMERLGLNN